MATRWEDARSELRREWESTVVGQRRPWEDVQDDVHFGWQAGVNPEFRGAAWPEVEEILQRRWEERYPHARFEDWRSVSDAIRLGFERGEETLEEAA